MRYQKIEHLRPKEVSKIAEFKDQQPRCLICKKYISEDRIKAIYCSDKCSWTAARRRKEIPLKTKAKGLLLVITHQVRENKNKKYKPYSVSLRKFHENGLMTTLRLSNFSTRQEAREFVKELKTKFNL